MKISSLRASCMLVLFALLAATGLRAAEPAEKYTIVIVHGATAGGWE